MQKLVVNRRILAMAIGFALLWVLLTARLFYLQIVQHDHLRQLALRQQERTLAIQPARGNIYDRYGRPLALNRKIQSFYAVPGEIGNSTAIARQLAPVLKMPATRLQQRLHSAKAFVWLKRKVDDETARQVLALKLPGVHALEESVRVYPEGKLACHVVGFVGLDNQGLAGIELQYDRQIQGQTGWIRVTQDANGCQLPTKARVFKESQAGQDLYLTLDKVIQHAAERELERGITENQAQSGSAVVMDARTGEILAMANYPDFDPNNFSQYPADWRRNRAVVESYEPGSTFKMITAAAALEEGVCRENEIIDCEQGKAQFAGLTVRDHEPQARISFADVIALSSNIGAVKIGTKVGAEKLYHYITSFGIGKTTGVELPGENRGSLKPFAQWRNWNTTTVSFGQGVAVNALQMTAAYTVLTHSGQRLKPWIVKALKTTDNEVTWEGKPEIEEQVISQQTALRISKILEQVVERGTGIEAKLLPYRVAGKTGTAQKSMTQRRGYQQENFVASFIGYLPAEDPRYIVSVTIDSPRRTQWGGVVAGPVFRSIGAQLVAYAGIPPSREKVFAFSENIGPAAPDEKDLQRKAVPALQGQTGEAAQRILRTGGWQTRVFGSGNIVAAQRPSAGTVIDSRTPVLLYLAAGPQPGLTAELSQQVAMPYVLGHSMRDALGALQAYGLRADVSGSGVVRTQDPLPGAPLELNEVCALQCADPEAHP